MVRSNGSTAIRELRQRLPLGLVPDLRVDLHRHFQRAVSEQLADRLGIRAGRD